MGQDKQGECSTLEKTNSSEGNSGTYQALGLGQKLGVVCFERVVLAVLENRDISHKIWTKDTEDVKAELDDLLKHSSEQVCRSIRSFHKKDDAQKFWRDSPNQANIKTHNKRANSKIPSKKTVGNIGSLIQDHVRNAFSIVDKPIQRHDKTSRVYEHLEGLLTLRAHFIKSYVKWCRDNHKAHPQSPSNITEEEGIVHAKEEMLHSWGVPSHLRKYIRYFNGKLNAENLVFMKGLDSILESLIVVRKFYQKGVPFAGSELLTSVEDNHNIVDFVLSLEGSIMGKRGRGTKKTPPLVPAPCINTRDVGVQTAPGQMTNIQRLTNLASFFRPATARQEPNATAPAQARDSRSGQGLPPVTPGANVSHAAKKRKVGNGG